MGTTFVDFAGVKERAKIQDVVAWLGLNMKLEKSTTLRGGCPTCGGDRTLAVTPNHTRTDGSVGSYYCHAEKKGGDSIGLVAHIKGVSQHDAAQLLHDRFGGGERREEPATPAKRPVERRAGAYDPNAYAARLDTASELLTPLNVSPSTFQAFQAGYASSGVHRGKLALPLHDREGKLIGHFGRSLKGESPLLSFVNGQNPAEHIFGAHLVTEGDLYIARDPLDVLIAHENGERNVVAFLTDGISAQQWEMISSLMDQRKVERSHLF
jgi:hypothetical protein